MFIRFSNQEDPEVYTPTATNTAGTFQLDAGSKIMGAINAKDYLLVLTDTAAFALQFVGPPFVFFIATSRNELWFDRKKMHLPILMVLRTGCLMKVDSLHMMVRLNLFLV
jgi:hypothetical protein